MDPRVEIPDGSHTFVLFGGDEEADGGVHYVAIDQDMDQCPKGPKV
jgi:hypothetical protein